MSRSSDDEYGHTDHVGVSMTTPEVPASLKEQHLAMVSMVSEERTRILADLHRVERRRTDGPGSRSAGRRGASDNDMMLRLLQDEVFQVLDDLGIPEASTPIRRLAILRGYVLGLRAPR